MEFIGIDVHQRDSQVCILAEGGEVVLEQEELGHEVVVAPYRGRPRYRISPCAGGTVRPKSSANRRMKKPRGEGWESGGTQEAIALEPSWQRWRGAEGKYCLKASVIESETRQGA